MGKKRNVTKKGKEKIHSEIRAAISHSLIAYDDGISGFGMCDHTYNKGKNIIVPM